MQDVLLEERKQIVDRIRNSEPGLGKLFQLSYRASKVAAHARQGDLSYLFEKLATRLLGRDDWTAH